jgi:4-hydroxybenzoate polyprenyltransferase
MLLAAQGWPQGWVSFWILSCMIWGRTSAMTFNRWADWHFDQHNPRTAERSQLASRREILFYFILSSLLFIASAWQIHLLCFVLSPWAIALFCIYSLMKRFSAMSHYVLGMALAAAPMGAWIAVVGNAWSPLPWMIAMAVLLWVAGFDIIYATQDIEADRKLNLHSIPAIMGYAQSLKISAVTHAAAWGAFLLTGLLGQFHAPYYGICLLIGALLLGQHRLASQNTPTSIQQAFFTLNIAISFLFLGATLIELWIQSLPTTNSPT